MIQLKPRCQVLKQILVKLVLQVVTPGMEVQIRWNTISGILLIGKVGFSKKLGCLYVVFNIVKCEWFSIRAKERKFCGLMS